MGKFKVSSEKETKLLLHMSSLGIREEDILESFVKSSGPGGQKVNKTSSVVCILHEPSGIQVRCQESRNQSLNRFLARRRLCDLVEAQIHGKKLKEQEVRERIRRQKRKRSKRAKEKVLADKKHRSKIKGFRKGPEF